jgi:hypothetical protein
MSQPNRKTQVTEIFQDMIIIDATVQKTEAPVGKNIRVCWNTGEEKNCPACYLSKGCKAKG